MEDAKGLEALKYNNSKKVWAVEKKMELVFKVLAGKSTREVAFEAGVNNSVLSQWVCKYKTLGYNGLVGKKIGRSSKNSSIDKACGNLSFG